MPVAGMKYESLAPANIKTLFAEKTQGRQLKSWELRARRASEINTGEAADAVEDHVQEGAETPPTPQSETSEECRQIVATSCADGLFYRAKLRLTCYPRWRRLYLAAARRREIKLGRLQDAMFVAHSLDDLSGLEELKLQIPPALWSWWGFELGVVKRASQRCRPEQLNVLPALCVGPLYPGFAAVAKVKAALEFRPPARSTAEFDVKHRGEILISLLRPAMEKQREIDMRALRDALDDPASGNWRTARTAVTAVGVNYGALKALSSRASEHNDNISEFVAWRPLHFVAGCRGALKTALEAMSLLLEARADPTLVEASGSTPLHIAALRGHANVIGMLLQFGAAVEARDNAGQTAMMVAARSRDFIVLRHIMAWAVPEAVAFELAEIEKKFERVNPVKGAEMLRAVMVNDALAVQRLVLEGEQGWNLADIHFTDPSGRQAVHCATSGISGELQASAMLRMLSGMKAAINGQDFTGQTPLHMAARLGRESVCRTLLQLKGHPGLIDKKGRTPLMAAAASSFDDSRDMPPYNGRVCNPAYPWPVIDKFLRWNGRGEPPDLVPLRPPGPPAPEPPAAKGSVKKYSPPAPEPPSDQEDDDLDATNLAAPGEAYEGYFPESDVVRHRADTLTLLGFDDQFIQDSEGRFNRGDRIQLWSHLMAPAGSRLHGVDGALAAEKDVNKIKPVENRCRLVWKQLTVPLLKLEMQKLLTDRQSQLLRYLLYVMLGRRGLVFSVLLTSSSRKPGAQLPFWEDFKQVIDDAETLEDRVKAVRDLGFRGPKPRKLQWVGSVWVRDEYPRDPKYAPWEAFKYVDEDTAYVLNQEKPGLHNEAFKGNRIWSLEHEAGCEEVGGQGKDIQMDWEGSPGFNWNGAIDRLPVPHIYDSLQLSNRLYVDEGLFQRATSEARIQLVAEKLLCPLLEESARTLQQSSAGLWFDGDDGEDEEAEAASIHRDLLRYVAAQLCAAAGRGAYVSGGSLIQKLNKPFEEQWEKTYYVVAVHLEAPADPELAQLTTSAVVSLPNVIEEAGEEALMSRGAVERARMTFKVSKSAENRVPQQVELIPEA
ncbi:unnamed protein product, partial [Polarella glacialis]